jgi:hypothetical protein
MCTDADIGIHHRRIAPRTDQRFVRVAASLRIRLRKAVEAAVAIIVEAVPVLEPEGMAELVGDHHAVVAERDAADGAVQEGVVYDVGNQDGGSPSHRQSGRIRASEVRSRSGRKLEPPLRS